MAATLLGSLDTANDTVEVLEVPLGSGSSVFINLLRLAEVAKKRIGNDRLRSEGSIGALGVASRLAQGSEAFMASLGHELSAFKSALGGIANLL
jgi:hypothetical protein